MIGRNEARPPAVGDDEDQRLEAARHDRGVMLDAEDDDWAWRRKIRANPASAKIYRIVVGIVGLVIVGGGLLLVPLPGPGWLIVFAGLAVWGSEFEWAQRLLSRVKARVRQWDTWIRSQPRWMQAVAMLLTVVAILALVWVLFRLSGIPQFFPDSFEGWLRTYARL